MTSQPKQTAALPTNSTVGHLLRRSQQVHTALWHTEFEGEITGPQYAILSVLDHDRLLDQTTAGEMASLDRSSVADVAARLVRNGWVARHRSEVDARRNVLTLTSAARAALGSITTRVVLVQGLLLESIAERERQPFKRTLRKVAYGGALLPDFDTSYGPNALALPLASAPGHLIRRSEQLHRQHWNVRVGNQLTSPQYGLLSTLAWNPDIDQRTARQLASLDKATAVEIVARLAQRGLIGMTRDETDRRRKRLALTDAAHRTVDAVTPAVKQVQADLVASLDREEVEILVTGLRAIADL